MIPPLPLQSDTDPTEASIDIRKSMRYTHNPHPIYTFLSYHPVSSLQSSDTWELVPFRLGKTVVGCRWIYTVKVGPDGKIDCLKARLVLDIKNSFLHSNLQEDVYMEQPPEFVAQRSLVLYVNFIAPYMV